MQGIFRTWLLMMTLALVLSMAGCGAHGFSELKRRLHAETDRIEIRRGSRVVAVTDPVTVRLVVDGVASESAPLYKCAYDGSIQFFCRGVALLPEPMEFNLSPACLHVKFVYRDSLHSKRISPGLAGFLRGL
ncbi:MAG TPA: hypothetical protein PKJ16_08765 [Spirochaetota bacterium]|nr:hypothetical protein [Spirochaetota bacterium]HPU88727.1 hypothetical protein [Spirochaetota bacterium]